MVNEVGGTPMTVGEVECEPATDALDDPATLHLIVNPAAGTALPRRCARLATTHAHT
jgi:hypothetical protein